MAKPKHCQFYIADWFRQHPGARVSEPELLEAIIGMGSAARTLSTVRTALYDMQTERYCRLPQQMRFKWTGYHWQEDPEARG